MLKQEVCVAHFLLLHELTKHFLVLACAVCVDVKNLLLQLFGLLGQCFQLVSCLVTPQFRAHTMDKRHCMLIGSTILLRCCEQNANGHRMASAFNLAMQGLAARSEVVVDSEAILYISAIAVDDELELVLACVLLEDTLTSVEREEASLLSPIRKPFVFGFRADW